MRDFITCPLGQSVHLAFNIFLPCSLNVTPAIIIWRSWFQFGPNSPDFPQMIYMIQMSVFRWHRLIQTVGFGPVGARLPVVQGTSFAFVPIMVPLVAGKGVDAMAIIMGGVIVGAIFHALLGLFIGRIRFALPPLVTGLIVLMIGLALIKVGTQYASGGVPAIGKPEYSLQNWSVAGVFIVVILALKFFARGMLSVAAVLIGILAGWAVAFAMGMVDFGNVGLAAAVALPRPLHFGIEFTAAAIIGFCAMAFVSAV